MRLVESGGKRYLEDSSGSGFVDVSGPAMPEAVCLEILHPLSCLFGIGCVYEKEKGV